MLMRLREFLAATALVTLLVTGSGVSWAQSPGPTDPQIAAIVVAANQVDIDAGKLAKSRSKTKDVQDFAQLMITDHWRGQQSRDGTGAEAPRDSRDQPDQPEPAKGRL
jgi:predicted outer membrane protein